MAYINSFSSFLKTRVGLTATFILGVLAISGALIAQAAENPSISTQIRNSSETSIGSAAIGTNVHAYAVLTAPTGNDPVPVGTVDFRVYQNESCSGTAITQYGVAILAGTATSSATSTPASGLSYRVHYNGQTDVYQPLDSSCVSIDATGNSITVSTSLSTTSAVLGASVYESATLNGETSDAGGSVTYTAYSNSSCTTGARDAGTKSVNDGSVPNSNSLTFPDAGTFYWQAVYSGDSDNEAATSTCRSLVISTNPGNNDNDDDGDGSIYGTVYNDEDKDGKKDSGEDGLSNFTVWLHKVPAGKTHNRSQAYNDPIVATETTDSDGEYDFDDLANGTYLVELKNESDWRQATEDRMITIRNGNDVEANFANYDTDTDDDDNGNGNGDDNDHSCSVGGHKGDKDNSDDNGKNRGRAAAVSFWANVGKHDNGNHFGWFKNGKSDKHDN